MSLDFEAPIIELERKIDELKKASPPDARAPNPEIAKLEEALSKAKKDVYAGLTPWQRVQVARHPNRPLLMDYISVFDEFIELHGDRCFGDDRALIGGFAMIGKHRVMLLGFDKGRSVEEKDRRNFGMAHPEGYRKAVRLMKLAEKHGLPIVSLIDTPAAYPGAAAEERGQAEAIARSISEMAILETPTVAVVTGEGGSGGALGIAVADVVLMLSNAIYSVIPPEGCAAILWRDANRAAEAAQALKLTSNELLALGVIDEVIEEPPGGAHRDHAAVAASVRAALIKHVGVLKQSSSRKIAARRVEKYARMGRAR